MGWAENRVREYRSGDTATWLERRMLEHANPVHFPLVMTGSAGLAYGLWTHRWPWIVGSMVVAPLGQAYCWTRPELGVVEGESVVPTSTRPIVR